MPASSSSCRTIWCAVHAEPCATTSSSEHWLVFSPHSSVDALLLLLRAPTRQVAPCMHQQCKHLQTAMPTIAIASHRKQAITFVTSCC
jgi:hypothetical protein